MADEERHDGLGRVASVYRALVGVQRLGQVLLADGLGDVEYRTRADGPERTLHVTGRYRIPAADEHGQLLHLSGQFPEVRPRDGLQLVRGFRGQPLPVAFRVLLKPGRDFFGEQGVEHHRDRRGREPFVHPGLQVDPGRLEHQDRARRGPFRVIRDGFPVLLRQFVEVPYDDDPAFGHHGHEGDGGQYRRRVAFVAAQHVQAERLRARLDDTGDQRVHGLFLAERLVAGEEVHGVDPASLHLLDQLFGIHRGTSPPDPGLAWRGAVSPPDPGLAVRSGPAWLTLSRPASPGPARKSGTIQVTGTASYYIYSSQAAYATS